MSAVVLSLMVCALSQQQQTCKELKLHPQEQLSSISACLTEGRFTASKLNAAHFDWHAAQIICADGSNVVRENVVREGVD